MVLIEHQSTINPNMALRFLLYIARIFEKTIDSISLYSKKRMGIPYPEFFVLYNGKDPFPDNAVYKLSDLFEDSSFPLLELEVKVVNINEGRNRGILDRCSKLAEYSAFTAKVREFTNELEDLEKAVKNAIKYCSRHDILKEYLEIHGSEVLNMLLTEWNTEDAIAYAREEGREEGLEEGLEIGREEGKLKIARNLLAEGSTCEFIQKITGLSADEIVRL